MNQNIILTHQNLHALGTRNGIGWNRKQLALLGVSWPPQKGWLSKLIGTEIDVDVYKALILLRNSKENVAKSKESSKETKSIDWSSPENQALLRRLNKKTKRWHIKQKEKRRKWLMSKPAKTNDIKTYKGCNRAKDWYGF
jgi:hypothetical protein